MEINFSLVITVYLLGGLILLYLGSELLILGAATIAKNFGIPQLVVGITIVAYGTSLPELFVSLASLINAEQEFIISNLLGSNLFNIAFILPIIIFLGKKEELAINDNTLVRIDIPVMALAGPLTFIALYMGSIGRIGRLDGIMLLGIFCTYWIIRVIPEIRKSMNAEKNPASQDENREKILSILSVPAIIAGGFLLWLGGNGVVKGAVLLAELFQISRHVIGATIIACGTSLPELITSIVALLRKKHGLSLGNVIGSSIVNIFMILGLIGLIKPFTSNSHLLFDVIIVCLTGGSLWLAVRITHRLTKFLALILLIFFGIYIAYLLYS